MVRGMIEEEAGVDDLARVMIEEEAPDDWVKLVIEEEAQVF